MVLYEEETLRLLDDGAEVVEDYLALVGELGVGVAQLGVRGERAECGVDL